MKTFTLGKTGIEIPLVSFGASALGGIYEPYRNLRPMILSLWRWKVVLTISM